MISVNGDGAFGINAMEIDTAVRHGAKCVFIVSNNAAWNIERLDQQLNYGGRVVGTTLRHSDYAAMARALGLHGERVREIGRPPSCLAKSAAKCTCSCRRCYLAGGNVNGRSERTWLCPRLSGAHGVGRCRAETTAENTVAPNTQCLREIATCPLLAQSRHADCRRECPLFGVKRTCTGHRRMSDAMVPPNQPPVRSCMLLPKK